MRTLILVALSAVFFYWSVVLYQPGKIIETPNLPKDQVLAAVDNLVEQMKIMAPVVDPVAVADVFPVHTMKRYRAPRTKRSEDWEGCSPPY